MARPRKSDADYFPHDKGMRHDPKILMLREKFARGYEVYNMLLETLSGSEGWKMEYDDLTVEMLAMDFRITEDELRKIIDLMIRIKLLVHEL